METVKPTCKNPRLINTQDSYKKCEENDDSSWARRNNIPINSWVLRDVHNYSVAILLPVFLALCFLISMLGAVFLFTSLFLGSKYNVMAIFINECNINIIILVFFSNGVHLLSVGITGVMGLGRRKWLLFLHTVLAMGALMTMLTNYYYEPRYESIVMGEAHPNMWSSLVNTRFRYHHGWNYIQSHMQCCGVRSYTDWCGCKNKTEKIKRNTLLSFFKAYVGPESLIELNTSPIASNSNKDQLQIKTKSSALYPKEKVLTENNKKIPGVDYDEYNEINSYEKQAKKAENSLFFSDKSQSSTDHFINIVKRKEEHNKNQSALDMVASGSGQNKTKMVADVVKTRYVIECYIPQSCCKVSSGFPYDIPYSKCLDAKDNSGLYSKGCECPVKHVMKRFINSFMSICKFIIMVMIIDLPLVLLMIST